MSAGSATAAAAGGGLAATVARPCRKTPIGLLVISMNTSPLPVPRFHDAHGERYVRMAPITSPTATARGKTHDVAPTVTKVSKDLFMQPLQRPQTDFSQIM